MAPVNVERLKRELCEFLNASYDDVLKKAKIEEAKTWKFLHPDKYYKDKVFNSVSDDVLDDFKVDIEFCETAEQRDLWEYFRIHTSSVKTQRGYGRGIRILVKHRGSQKYIGILGLSGDVYRYKARDDYIGWSNDQFKAKLKYVMNISCCVGLQPIAYNLNVGKLLVALCYSDVILGYMKEKYGHDIACITTFSINGKSIQYDRMKPYLKYVGETKGCGFPNIPEKLYRMCCEYLKDLGDTRALSYVNRLHKVSKVIRYLDIDDVETANNRVRGAYIGFTSEDAIGFLRGEKSTFDIIKRSVDDVTIWWGDRWAKQRFNHLKQTQRLRHNIEFINAYKLYNINKNKISIEKKKEAIGTDEYRRHCAEVKRKYREKTVEINTIEQLNLFTKSVSDQSLDLQWLAGFIDGDGCIYTGGNYNTIILTIAQCNPLPLLYIQKCYGGVIACKKNTAENARPIFSLNMYGTQCGKIFTDIANHVIIEKRNVENALGFLNALSLAQDGSKFLDAIKSTGKLSNNADHNRISMQYIAGLFDAEGEVSIRLHSNATSGSYSLDITQKGDIELLTSIRKHLGYGKMSKERVYFWSKDDINRFINEVGKYSIVKKESCRVMSETLKKKMPLNQAIEAIQNEKHKVVTLAADLLKEQNIKGKSRIKEENKQPLTEAKKKAREEQNRIRSESMKGEKNPNFGKERSFEHSLGIKKGTLLNKHSKRKVTDEQILSIREKYSKGAKVTALAKEYNVCHQYMSKIVNKEVLTLEEINDEENIRNILTTTIQSSSGNGKEKNVISRRKASAEVIMEIMHYKHTNPTKMPKEILEHFSKKCNVLTIDMVKNYIAGKALLFESEFPLNGISYTEYINIVGSLKK